MLISFTCKVCKQEFEYEHTDGRKRTMCSSRCRSQNYKNNHREAYNKYQKEYKRRTGFNTTEERKQYMKEYRAKLKERKNGLPNEQE